MTKEMMIAEAKKNLESVSGYHYNSQRLEEVINAGIPDGAVIMSETDLTVTRVGNKAIGKDKKGNVLNEMELTGEFADFALIQYAMTESRLSSSMGRI